MKRSGKFFVIYTSNKEPNKDPRVDIVTGVNFSKKAVLRNKIRRQVKDVFRGAYLKSAKPVVNIKIVALPNALNVAFGELKIDLEKTLKGL